MAINRDFLNANHAELVAEIRGEGRAEGLEAGRTEGASAERARIQAVAKTAMPGCEKLVAELMYDGQTTPEQAAARVLAHYKGINAGALERIQADAAALPKVPANPSPGGEGSEAAAEAGLPIEERCKRAWDRDPKIRAEFSSFENYFAFEKANAAGKVRVFGWHRR